MKRKLKEEENAIVIRLIPDPDACGKGETRFLLLCTIPIPQNPSLCFNCINHISLQWAAGRHK